MAVIVPRSTRIVPPQHKGVPRVYHEEVLLLLLEPLMTETDNHAYNHFWLLGQRLRCWILLLLLLLPHYLDRHYYY